ncbi:hypothetical protein ACIOK4_43510 [Streptomyces bottropensis]
MGSGIAEVCARRAPRRRMRDRARSECARPPHSPPTFC